MQQKLITVGITSYNHEKYIAAAMDSVLLEDYVNKEIVIIDDGSRDRSVEIINEWIERNRDVIKVKFISRPNKGLTITYNEIIENANGQYVAWLSSDDAFCNNGLSKRMDLLEKSNKMAVVGDSIVIDENGARSHSSWMKDFMKVNIDNYKSERGIMKETLVHPAISGSVLLMDKDIFKKIGKYPENFYAEEWFFYQRSAAQKLIAYLDEPVSLYRRHSENTSGQPNPKRRKHLVKSIIKSYAMSWNYFPGTLKLTALGQWLKWIKSYIITYYIKRGK